MLLLLESITGHCTTSNNLLPFKSGHIHVLNKVFIIISSVLFVTIITHEIFHQSLTSLVFCTVSLVYPANKEDPLYSNPTMVLASQNSVETQYKTVEWKGHSFHTSAKMFYCSDADKHK